MIQSSDHKELELTAIGMALNNKQVACQIAVLPDGVWMFEDTTKIAKAIKTLVTKGDDPSILSVTNLLGSDTDETVMLMRASELGFAPSGYKQVEAMLIDHWQRRRIISACERAILQTNDMGRNPDEILAEAVKDMRSDFTSNEDVSLRDAMMSLIDMFDENKDTRIKTGIGKLDMITGGFWPGQMIVIGARPGVGKTALALFMAVYAATNGKRVLFSSLEMDASEITARITSARTEIDLQRIVSGDLTLQEQTQIVGVGAEIASLPIVVNTRLNSPMKLWQKVSSMKNSKEGLDLVVVDYLQLMEADGKTGSRYEAVSQISRRVKQIAMEHHVPIIALTQFNRTSEPGEGRTKKRRPSMAEAKDSGSIEQDANVFITQFAPDEPDSGFAREAYLGCQKMGTEFQILTVEKNRQGKTGQIPVSFDKAHMKFTGIINDTGMRW